MDHDNCRCPCTCGHAHDKALPATCTFCQAMTTHLVAKREGRTMSIHDIAKRINEVNAENGFDGPTMENLPSKVMFAVTELDEGMDAIEGVGPDPLSEELADTAIRCLSILDAVWGADWVDRTSDVLQKNDGVFEPGQVALWRPLRMLCKAVEEWRHDRKLEVRIGLEMAVMEVFILGARLGVDMHAEIEWKVGKNATRGKLYGKVRSAG